MQYLKHIQYLQNSKATLDLNDSEIEKYRNLSRKKSEIARKQKNMEMWNKQDRENLRLVKEFGEIADGKKLGVYKAADTVRLRDNERATETVLQQLKNR